MALPFGKGKKGGQDANAAPGGAEALDESWFEEAFDAEAAQDAPVVADGDDFLAPMEEAVEDDFSAFAELDATPVTAAPLKTAAPASAAFDMSDFAPPETETYAPDLSDLPPIPTGKKGKVKAPKAAKTPKAKGEGGGIKKLLPIIVLLIVGGGGGYFWISQQNGGSDGTDSADPMPTMPDRNPPPAKPDDAKPDAKPAATDAKPVAPKPDPKPEATAKKPAVTATGQAPIVEGGSPDTAAKPSAKPTKESPFKSKVGKLWAEGIVYFHKGDKAGARKKWEAAVKLANTKPEGANSAAAIQEAIDNKLK